ncbi:MAG: phage/plasmid primase, P4 family [Desulfovibrionaceae bacterium]|nr:phage/plasmid primase, P4 family [Desulfovibrionaceae bacterium]
MADEKKDENVIREQVMARARQEEEEAAARGESSGVAAPELTHDFVMQCLYANELGDGMLFAALFRLRHAYVGQAGEWMTWRGHHWRIDDIDNAHLAQADVEGVVEAYQRTRDHYFQASKEAEESGDGETAKRLKAKCEALKGRINKLRSKTGRLNCLNFAKTNRDAPLAIRGDEFDRDPWALPVANGVLDLKTGLLRPGRPEEYLMRASPVEWRSIDEPCPAWEKALLEIMDEDREMVEFLRRIFGYGLTGLVSEHKFLVLYGKGRNGKSIITDIIMDVLGGTNPFSALARVIQSEMLLDQGKVRSSAGPSPDIMSLRGMRLAFASETDEGQRFSAARVKWLSGGDKLTGRYPHDKRDITFDPTHLLCLLTNNKPHAPATDFAFWERLLLVDFPISFVDRKPQGAKERAVDKALSERLRQELPGILAWLVRGCLEWQKVGLAPPLKVLEAVAEYRKSEDLLGEFLEDCCELIKDNPDSMRTLASELYDTFMLWFRANISAKKDFSQKAFGKLMKERFRRERVGGHYYYYGLRVLQSVRSKLKDQDKEDQDDF